MNTFSKSDGKESSLRRESELANPGEEYISASSLQRSNQFLFLDPNSQISNMNSCRLCRMRNVSRCEYSNVMIYMTSDDTCDATYDQWSARTHRVPLIIICMPRPLTTLLLYFRNQVNVAVAGCMYTVAYYNMINRYDGVYSDVPREIQLSDHDTRSTCSQMDHLQARLLHY